MKLIKKINIFIIAMFVLLIPISSFASENMKVVGVDDQVRAYIIGNEETGEIFYEKNADSVYPIASMSKLMTYLLVKEAIDKGDVSLDQEITISEEAAEYAAPGNSALGLEEGEKFTVKELIEGLMVVSGNDCAYQLSQVVAKRESEFVKLMNKRAEELGLESQVFYNSSGLQTEDNHQNSSSARDLFKLSQEVIKKYPEVLELSKIRKIENKSKGIDKESTIPLIDDIKGVDGLKTGSTLEALYCLTSTVDMKKIDEKDDFRTIGIVMGADSYEARDMAMSDLIYYVSRYFDTEEILNTEIPVERIKMNTASKGYVELYPTQSIKFIVKNGTIPSTKYNIDDDKKAPINEGEKLGSVEIAYKDQKFDVDLVTKTAQKRATSFTRVVRSIQDYCDFLLECIIAR